MMHPPVNMTREVQLYLLDFVVFLHLAAIDYRRRGAF